MKKEKLFWKPREEKKVNKEALIKVLFFVSMLLIVVAVTWVVYMITSSNRDQSFNDPIKGIKPYITVTNSMEPVLEVSGMIIVSEFDYDKLKMGDIISFTVDEPQYYGKVITHRIYQITADNKILTKGDNNLGVDDWKVDRTTFKGKVVSIWNWVKVFNDKGKINWVTVTFFIVIPMIIVTLFLEKFVDIIRKRLNKSEKYVAQKQKIRASRDRLLLKIGLKPKLLSQKIEPIPEEQIPENAYNPDYQTADGIDANTMEIDFANDLNAFGDIDLSDIDLDNIDLDSIDFDNIDFGFNTQQQSSEYDRFVSDDLDFDLFDIDDNEDIDVSTLDFGKYKSKKKEQFDIDLDNIDLDSIDFDLYEFERQESMNINNIGVDEKDKEAFDFYKLYMESKKTNDYKNNMQFKNVEENNNMYGYNYNNETYPDYSTNTPYFYNTDNMVQDSFNAYNTKNPLQEDFNVYNTNNLMQNDFNIDDIDLSDIENYLNIKEFDFDNYYSKKFEK